MLTYSTRLVFSTEEDNVALFKMLEVERFCWNECSKVKFSSVPKNSITDLHAQFYKSFRESQPHIPSNIVIQSEQTVLSAYRSIKSNKHKISSPCIKNKVALRLNARLFSKKQDVLSIISLGSRIKCTYQKYPKLTESFLKYKFCDPLLFVKNSEIWIAFTFNDPKIPSPQTSCLGVDFGCRINATTSEGNLYVDKTFNGRKRSLRNLKDSLKSCGTKSARKHLKKLRPKERNINRNFTHHLANAIIKGTSANVITLEDLKGIKKKKDFRSKNRISQVPLFQLKQFLTYKAPMVGKTVISVKPHYTSQIDSQSGKLEGERKKRRFYATSGIIYDADVNAAINIAKRSKLPVSQTSRLTYGQAIVNSPIVCKSIPGTLGKVL